MGSSKCQLYKRNWLEGAKDGSAGLRLRAEKRTRYTIRSVSDHRGDGNPKLLKERAENASKISNQICNRTSSSSFFLFCVATDPKDRSAIRSENNGPAQASSKTGTPCLARLRNYKWQICISWARSGLIGGDAKALFKGQQQREGAGIVATVLCLWGGNCGSTTATTDLRSELETKSNEGDERKPSAGQENFCTQISKNHRDSPTCCRNVLMKMSLPPSADISPPAEGEKKRRGQ